MITTTLTWHTDMAAAPRGEVITTKRTMLVKGKQVEQSIDNFAPTFILALTKCGKIVRTYWIPGKAGTLDGERWSGLNRGEQPLMWTAWPDAGDLLPSLHKPLSGAVMMGDVA